MYGRRGCECAPLVLGGRKSAEDLCFGVIFTFWLSAKYTTSCNLSTVDGLLCKDLGSWPIRVFFHALFFLSNKRPDVEDVEDQGI